MILAREIPFVKLVLPLILGLICAFYFSIDFSFLLPIAVFSFIFLLIGAFANTSPTLRKVFSANIYFLFFLVGCAFMTLEKGSTAIGNDLMEDPNSFILKVDHLPKYSSRIQFHSEIIGYHSYDSIVYGRFGKVYTSLEKKEITTELQKGDLIFVDGKIRAITSAKNPNNFDFKNFLEKKGVNGQIYTSKTNWKILERNKEFSIINTAQQIQRKCVEIFNQYIPSVQESSIVKALVLGSKTDLDPSIRDAYANTGALHVLAVSGLHVGLVYGFLFFLVKGLNKRKWYAQLVRIFVPLLGIWLFTFISGASPSVVRASTMLSLVLIAKNIRRYPSIYNTIAFTALIMLLIDPFQIFNISFQLSFLALLGIIYFQPKIYRLWNIDNWLGDKFWLLCTVGIAAQLGTFPIAIYYFHQFPVYFWLSGIVVIPAAAIILGLGLLLLSIHYILPIAAPLVAKALYGVVWLMNAIIFLIQSIPFSSLSGFWPSIFTILILYLFIILLAYSISFKKKSILFISLLGFLGLAISPLILKAVNPPINKLCIYSIREHSMVDYLRGSKVYTFESESLEMDLVDRIATPFREANKIEKVFYSLPNKINEDIKGIDFYQINQLRFAINTQQSFDLPGKKVDVDFLIITSNSSWKIEKILEKFNPQYLIFDASNYPWNISKWKSNLKEKMADEKIIDIQKRGACIIDFESGEISQQNGQTLEI